MPAEPKSARETIKNDGDAHQTYTWGTGRRKTAVARVRIREGTGQFIVNDLESTAYFPLVVQQKDIREPLNITDMAGRIDVFVNVRGSGKLSQSGAVMLGLARALKEFRPDLEPKTARKRFAHPRRSYGRAQKVRP